MQEKVFKVNYIPCSKSIKHKWTSNVLEKIKKNQFIIILLSIILLASGINLILFYNFIKLLETLI